MDHGGVRDPSNLGSGGSNRACVIHKIWIYRGARRPEPVIHGHFFPANSQREAHRAACAPGQRPRRDLPGIWWATQKPLSYCGSGDVLSGGGDQADSHGPRKGNRFSCHGFSRTTSRTELGGGYRSGVGRSWVAGRCRSSGGALGWIESLPTALDGAAEAGGVFAQYCASVGGCESERLFVG